MKYEIGPNCATHCPYADMRDAMVAGWQEFEGAIALSSIAEVSQEGRYVCPDPKSWRMGPFGPKTYSCESEVSQPKAALVDEIIPVSDVDQVF